MIPMRETLLSDHSGMPLAEAVSVDRVEYALTSIPLDAALAVVKEAGSVYSETLQG